MTFFFFSVIIGLENKKYQKLYIKEEIIIFKNKQCDISNFSRSIQQWVENINERQLAYQPLEYSPELERKIKKNMKKRCLDNIFTTSRYFLSKFYIFNFSKDIFRKVIEKIDQDVIETDYDPYNENIQYVKNFYKTMESDVENINKLNREDRKMLYLYLKYKVYPMIKMPEEYRKKLLDKFRTDIKLKKERFEAHKQYNENNSIKFLEYMNVKARKNSGIILTSEEEDILEMDKFSRLKWGGRFLPERMRLWDFYRKLFSREELLEGIIDDNYRLTSLFNPSNPTGRPQF